MKKAEKASFRLRRLQEITSGTWAGEIDGIHFDLRHRDLNPRSWRTDTLGDPRWYASQNAPRPRIWFPWYGNFDTMLRSCIKRDERYAKRKLTEPEVSQIRNDLSPEYIVSPGDIITIESVATIPISERITKLDAREDAYFQDGYLLITHADGTVERPSQPMRFFPVTYVEMFNEENNFFMLKARADRFAKDIDKDDYIPTLSKRNVYALEALLAKEEVEDYLKRYEKALSKAAGRERSIAQDVLQIASQAAYFGYTWAKAEAKENLLPVIEASARSRVGASKGGKRSGEARRNPTWKPIVERYLKSIIGEQRLLSQDDLAEKVRDAKIWDDPDVAVPGHETLKRFIRVLERTGQIPRRKNRKPTKTTTRG
jgi:hypothetical protein